MISLLVTLLIVTIWLVPTLHAPLMLFNGDDHDELSTVASPVWS